MKAVYTRTRTAGAEDVAVTTHDLWQDADTWTDGQCDTVAAAFNTFWTTIKATMISTSCKLSELRFYKGYDGDGSPGAVDYIKTYSSAGTAGISCPPQVACTVTELTDSRRHWGRFYIPGISINLLDVDGSLTSSGVTAVANAAKTMYNAWGAMSGPVTPIVWSRSSHPIEYAAAAAPRWRGSFVTGGAGHVWGPANAVSVQAIRVDEILDVQRPRRYESTQIRNTQQLA